MNNDTDIIIVGGGLIGSALAIALSSIGFDVTVVDRQSNTLTKSQNFDGRAYALSHASIRMLKVLGIWNYFKENAQPILDIKVSDGRVGEGASDWFLHFDHQELEEGPMGHLIEDRYIRAALKTDIEMSKQIKYIYNAEVISQNVKDTSVSLNLSDGQALRAQLLVGCDGRNSKIAQWSNISHVGWNYNQTALVCALSHEKQHFGVAHQFFNPAGPLAILPLKGNKSSIVWTETKDRAKHINDMCDEDYLNALSPFIGNFLGLVALFHFDVASKIVSLAKAPNLVLDSILYPRAVKIKNKKFLNKWIQIKIVLAIIISVICWFFAKDLVAIISGESNKETVKYVRWLIPVLVITSISYFIGGSVLVANNYNKIYNNSVNIGAIIFLIILAILYFLNLNSLFFMIGVILFIEFLVFIIRYVNCLQKNIL